MRDSKDLYTVGDVIKKLLIKDERCRNDDGYLYFKVVEAVAAIIGEDIMYLSLQDYLTNKHGREYPCFATVLRSRTKVQELNPELRSNKVVSDFRAANEEEFKHWARVYGQ